MKKLLKSALVGLMITAIFVIPTLAATNASTSSSNNPYIQQYLNEKNSETSGNQALVDSQEEDKEMRLSLQYYYNEDIKVAKILKNYCKDSNLETKTLSLKKEDKVEVMNDIINVYSSVKNKTDQKTLQGYFLRYADNSKDEKLIAFLNQIVPKVESTHIDNTLELEQQEKKGISTTNNSSASTLITPAYTGTYSHGAAGEWAYNNYNNYDTTSFPAFTATEGSYTDCANFVSRAMYTGGGMPMQGTWYCYKKNNTYPNPINATQLNYSWTFADPSPWISAVQFESFWRTNAISSIYSTGYYISNHSTIYNYSIYKGDAVVLRKGVAGWITVPSHVMIISAYDSINQDFKLAGHSRERQAHPLLTACQDYSEIQFIRF